MRASNLDLSQPSDILTYLAETPFASTLVTPLSGGYANFTFRLHLSASYKGQKSVVLKHAKPYVAMTPSWPFAVERQNFEAEALGLVKKMLPADSLVTVPMVYLYDNENHVIIMEDGGEDVVTLRRLALENPPHDSLSHDIGSGLGVFLATLHEVASGSAEMLQYFDGHREGKELSAYLTYGRVTGVLTGDESAGPIIDPPLSLPPSDLAMISHIAAETTEAMIAAKSTFTMGDFHPGNILVRLRRSSDEDGTLTVERVYIVDWEVAKDGLEALDVGQFAGDTYKLCHFFPETEKSLSIVLTAFLEAYSRKRPVGHGFVKQAAVHVGAHLMTWGTMVPEGTMGRKREIVVEGVEHMLGGYEGDRAWLKQSLVGGLCR